MMSYVKDYYCVFFNNLLKWTYKSQCDLSEQERGKGRSSNLGLPRHLFKAGKPKPDTGW